ncbi:MAG: GTPase ObgE [Treponemataceae bacterium]|nr:MAG: GTPase ObgE [Treponemataceae bacterium]
MGTQKTQNRKNANIEAKSKKKLIKFADDAVITVRSGKGGNGCIAFRREKYIPLGGPAGGDGGKGGDVVFCLKHNLRTLSHLRKSPIFKARNGADGEGSNRHGKDGDDVRIPLPPGALIKDFVTDELLFDFADSADGTEFAFLTGGKGGWGNSHFKSSVTQAPRYAHGGTEGEEKKLYIELSIIADIALVGFPNAGKSSLLDFFTNARPKIAPYPFTTKIPNLGMLTIKERDIVIADIPGIIEGASDGAGLGIQFLKHISRTAALGIMIDCSDDLCYGAYDILLDEITHYSADLLKKPRIVLCSKTDTEGAFERAKKVEAEIFAKESAQEKPIVIPMSVFSQHGLTFVKDAFFSLVKAADVAAAKEAAATAVTFAITDRTADFTGEAIRESAFLASRSCVDVGIEQFPGQERA